MARAQDVPEAGRRKTDVLVIGGGTAGCIAALQAARAGARTTLIEMGSQLGGTTTTGGVSFPGLFHAWGKQVIAGIGWEMVQDAVRLDGGQMPDFSRTPAAHYQHQVRINGPLYAALLEEACLQAGVSLAYYQFPLSATATKHGWSLEIVGKGLRYSIVCRQLIDCTGGADIVGLAGLPRMREETTQPGTLIFRLGGYHVADLDAAEIQRRYLQALADGELEHSDARGPRTRFVNFLASGGDNSGWSGSQAFSPRHGAHGAAGCVSAPGQSSSIGGWPQRFQRPTGQFRTPRPSLMHGHGPGSRSGGSLGDPTGHFPGRHRSGGASHAARTTQRDRPALIAAAGEQAAPQQAYGRMANELTLVSNGDFSFFELPRIGSPKI